MHSRKSGSLIGQMAILPISITVGAAFPTASSAQEITETQELETVTVIGTRERAYRAVVAPTANKSDTLIKETPFSIQTVTRELMEDRGVVTFGEAVRTVPGLTSQVGWGGSNDRFRLRGFATTANLKNGFRRSVFSPVDELVNIEQIEVLKGPASALYGRFEPGGVVNLVTKKPLSKQQTQFNVTAGSYDFYRATVDTTGPISDTLGYRLTGAWQDNHSFRDLVEGRSTFISPVLQWKPSSQTTLTAELELGHKKASFDRGFGSDPLFLKVPIENNYAEPDARYSNDSRLGSLVLDHVMDNGWELKAGVQASYAETDATWYPYSFFAPITNKDTSNPTVNRKKQRNIDEQKDFNVMAEMARRFETGTIRHRVLIGVDASRDTWNYTVRANTTNLPIDLYNPVYDQTVAGPLLPTDASRYTGRSFGLYAQDEIELSKQWRVLLGLRHDRVRSSARTEHLPTEETMKRSDSATSPRVGITFTPIDEVSLYASWAKSFLTEPSTGLLRSGNLPAPSEGRQVEVGAKLSLLEGRLEPTFAVFDIRRTNGIVSDPDDFNYVIQVGEQRSRGWEIDVPFMVTPQWRLLGSYTHMKAEISDDSNPALVGNLIANAPRRSASFWSTYDFRDSAAGLSLGLGAIYVGEREANTANTFQLPSYTRWDANATYRFGLKQQYKLQLTIQNLTDKRYYDSGGSFVPTYPGAPRTFLATFGMSL